MHVKSLNLTPKGVGGNSELQTDGDVQSRDISHLDGRELQVNQIIFDFTKRNWIILSEICWIKVSLKLIKMCASIVTLYYSLYYYFILYSFYLLVYLFTYFYFIGCIIFLA